ncbi:hypothetical protein F2Q70_00038230 [Brassica cretica]|uniref:Uncharacterized protein n=1 Tax=Brassica cretica TaxID=69181 RepID=A0A8S9KE09_BRACR|nr:hypothetical protein F2Q70_00038230 [Brassica cretica]
MHGFVSYRCFGIVQLLRSDRALVRSRSLRARLLRSDRAVRVLGRYVATSSCAGQSLRSDLDLSPMFCERVFSATS